jgi:hypothetical protein
MKIDEQVFPAIPLTGIGTRADWMRSVSRFLCLAAWAVCCLMAIRQCEAAQKGDDTSSIYSSIVDQIIPINESPYANLVLREVGGHGSSAPPEWRAEVEVGDGVYAHDFKVEIKILAKGILQQIADLGSAQAKKMSSKLSVEDYVSSSHDCPGLKEFFLRNNDIPIDFSLDSKKDYLNVLLDSPVLEFNFMTRNGKVSGQVNLQDPFARWALSLRQAVQDCSHGAK